MIAARAPRPPGFWRRAVLWLLLLAPLFFATYGFANWMTARKDYVGSVVYAWESAIPLWPWTIVPYWSIDLLYGFSLLLCRSADELDTHARRLLTVQAISVTCFLLFPLRFSLERPALDGVFGAMFDVLMGFDQPFNQAPSLHIALLVVLWVRYAAHATGWLRALTHGWFLLIGISVLTTWQHHFIDVPTGVLAGWVAVWLWPMGRPSPLRTARLARSPQRWRLALGYLFGSALCTAAAMAGGAWLWMSWPAIALLMVALNYACLGAEGFQKSTSGRLSVASRWLLFPYLLAARFNAWAWTHRRPAPAEIADGVWVGRLPPADELARSPFATIIDLSAELSACPGSRRYRSVPALDLVPPDQKTCMAAAYEIEAARTHGPVLVCCALGYSRSATAAAAWLLLTGRAADADRAFDIVRTARPAMVAGPSHRHTLHTLPTGSWQDTNRSAHHAA